MARRTSGSAMCAGLLVVAAFTGALLTGCGPKEAPRYHLAGKVSWAGKPIPKGVIYFDPDIAAGVDGPQGYAMIDGGLFDTRQGGAGHGGGKYVMRIFAGDGIVGPEAPMGKPLFPEYTWAEELPKEEGVKDFVIPANVRAMVAK